MKRMLVVVLIVVLCCNAVGEETTSDKTSDASLSTAPVALTEIDRSIGKEPDYTTRPKYAVLLLGQPKSLRRIWFVQDDDHLYVDKNANGDLTDEGEKNVGKRTTVGRYGKQRKYIKFVVDGILDSKQREFGIVYEHYDDRTLGDFFHLYTDFKPKQFQKGERLQGLPGDDAGEFCFSPKREDCPVYHFQGPLTMIPVGTRKFQHGVEDDWLTIRIGTLGLGKGSFAAIENDQAPRDVHPVAEILFPAPNKARADKPIRVKMPLLKRC